MARTKSCQTDDPCPSDVPVIPRLSRPRSLRWRAGILGCVDAAPGDSTVSRRASARRYLMCPPEYFDVTYAINPWMRPEVPTDLARVHAQWEALRAVYLGLGHQVELVEPVPGLPDMVYAANGGLVVDGVAVGARFRYPQRRAEADHYLDWFRGAGMRRVHAPSYVNEGEGDFLPVGGVVLAGTGFRTEPRAHAEVAGVLGRRVLTLELVDPRFYHLDTALCVLTEDLVAYYPAAFSARSNALLRETFPGALTVSEREAVAFALNAVSDGLHVVISADAVGFASTLRDHGFIPVGVATDEIRRGGGGAKCCTLELRPAG
ncbi:dimethylargininase [Frankia sp. Mgl5]|uniref:dimethylargininase n=1 Tax=Frankia sp. Mgl5 TaxID=2933793 RepID=UPI0034D64CDC